MDKLVIRRKYLLQCGHYNMQVGCGDIVTHVHENSKTCQQMMTQQLQHKPIADGLQALQKHVTVYGTDTLCTVEKFWGQLLSNGNNLPIVNRNLNKALAIVDRILNVLDE